jgi:hypothetical protein
MPESDAWFGRRLSKASRLCFGDTLSLSLGGIQSLFAERSGVSKQQTARIFPCCRLNHVGVRVSTSHGRYHAQPCCLAT